MPSLSLARRVNRGNQPFFGPANLPGRSIYVSPTGSDTDNQGGLNPTRPLKTITQAIAVAEKYDTIFLDPGDYDETVTISRSSTVSDVSIVGLGGRGAAIIEPSTSNADGLVNHMDGLSLHNLTIKGNGTGTALENTGSRLRVTECKLGVTGALSVDLTEGTTAQIAALTHGEGDDVQFFNCVIGGTADGVKLTATNNGVMTGILFENCHFAGCSASSFEEAGGTAANRFRNLVVRWCHFGPGDVSTGAMPTKWFSLDDSNSNTGEIIDCSFPDTLTSGRNLVSSLVLWVCNRHPAGLSTGQPT